MLDSNGLESGDHVGPVLVDIWDLEGWGMRLGGLEVGCSERCIALAASV